MSKASRYVPWVVAGLGALCFVYAALPRRDRAGEMRLEEFGRLPVVDRGRVKPLDTMARISLMMISNRQTYYDLKEKRQPAIKWLLDAMTSNPRVFEHKSDAIHLKVFRIENDQVLDMLDLKPRPGSYRYALSEFGDRVERFMARADMLDNKDAKKRDLVDNKTLQLAHQIKLFFNLSSLSVPYVVPPEGGGDEWRPLRYFPPQSSDDPSARAFWGILQAYAAGDVAKFNAGLDEYRGLLEKRLPDDVSRAGFETFFNNFSPFYVCCLAYVVVFLLAAVGWLVAPQVLHRSAFWLAVVALVVHTGALLARMYLTGRPLVFVTNLYSSAVFIGWMSVVLGLILERIYHHGIGTALAGLTGAASLVVAHHLGSDGDTLEMLQAVLDTNFWLATHVTTVTIGYAATFVAGFLGMTYIFVGFFTPHLQRDLQRTLTQMIYGIVCFAMLFSFVGTVLGGIWADQSWGRFWGWDPKENGALLIVLWNALILHARWGGLIKQRGLAVLAVVGNMVTGWSWFGTNQLGVGLHAYGFSNTLALALEIFWLTQAVVVLCGLLPLSWWRSFGPQKAPAPPSPR